MALCWIGAAVILTGVRALHLFGYKNRRIIPLRLKAVNLFDTISPTFNHEHTPAEVRQWFIETGFSDVKDVSVSDFRLNKAGFAMRGTRAPGRN